MKQLSIVLVFAFAIFSLPSFANNNNTGKLLYKVKPLQEKTITLRLANLQQQSTKVSIKSLSGTVYFEDFIRKHNGYIKKINLERLPNGKYTVNIKNGSTEIVQVIVIKENDIQFSQATRL